MHSMPRWSAIGTLALYMILVAFGTIADFDTYQQFVKHLLAVDTTNLGQPPGTGCSYARRG
jgi:predicted small integral membrane protein